jgi:branched-chain amino acid transport system ATP-binding protein
MTVRENAMVGLHPHQCGGLLAVGLRTPRIRRQERRARAAADALLARFGLSDLAERRAATLSLGQQRLLELARAIAAGPRLLMLDEAASGMSPAELAELARHVRELRASGITILLVEHNMRFVSSIAEHLIVLNYGRVIFDGAIGAGLADPAVVAAYLGRKG